MTSDVVRFCRSRNEGRRCTRPLAHAGLHRHRTIMWTDAGADPARCPGSGTPGSPAAPLADGWPHGRALCGVCHRFIELDEHGGLDEHDTFDVRETARETARRREWLNRTGW